MRKQIAAALAAVIISAVPAMAAEDYSKWAVSTNLPTWAALAGINAQIHFSCSRQWSLEAGFKYNPFGYNGNQLRLKQATPCFGVRWWPAQVYEGWFAGARLLGSVYNVAGLGARGSFEGELAGAGLVAGYNMPISGNVSLSLGCGIAAAMHRTTFYEGARCGRILERKKGLRAFASDAIVSLFIKL